MLRGRRADGARTIRYGDISNNTSNVVEDAARAAQLHTAVQQLPHGYDTQVGERGLKVRWKLCSSIAR